MSNGIKSHMQSVAKAFTWRATAGADTLFIGWFITGHLGMAIGIVGTEFLTKSFLYYLHERAWHIDWKRPRIQWSAIRQMR